MPTTSELAMRAGDPVQPSVTVIVQVPSPSREAFFLKLRSFAADKKFVITIQPNLQFKETFDIDLARSDFWVIGSNLFDSSTFKLGFYVVPPSSEASSGTTELAQNLKGLLSEFNAVTVSPQ
jgi:hypothetical protein